MVVMLSYSEASALLVDRRQILREYAQDDIDAGVARGWEASDALREEPAVDDDGLAGGVAGRGADEVDGRARDLVGVAEPAERGVRLEPPAAVGDVNDYGALNVLPNVWLEVPLVYEVKLNAPPSTRCSMSSAPRATPPVASKPAATKRAPAVMVIAC